MQRGGADWQAVFGRLAEEQRGPTLALLRDVVANPPVHARFMNTLSLLEHLGSRKIMLSQQAPGIDQDTLKHLTEEARHAWFFRRQAERLAGRALDYRPPQLLAPASAWMYFQRLEAGVRRRAGQAAARVVYPLTSLLIEFRATWFYRLYQQVLDELAFPLSLKKLAGEEAVHLREMTALVSRCEALQAAALPALLTAEQRLYARLLGGLRRGAALLLSAAA